MVSAIAWFWLWLWRSPSQNEFPRALHTTQKTVPEAGQQQRPGHHHGEQCAAGGTGGP